MTWETPSFVEVKMDAEINSYQDDFEPDRDPGV
jgi:coenzyme PQQ precursor peptide PqqA